MIKGVNTRGFTILEVMIVLAVTAALFVSAFALINGQQQRTQFSQAANDAKSQLDTIINNVATGFYSSNNDFTCTVNGGGDYDIQTAAPGTDTRGTNTDCIYIGRAIQYGVNGTNNTKFNVYNLVGQQFNGGTTLATDLATIKPIALTYTSAPAGTANVTVQSGVDTTENHGLLYGLNVSKMYYNNVNDAAHAIGAFALISSLGSYSGGDLNPGAQSVQLYAIPGTSLGQTPDSIIGQQIDLTSSYTDPINPVNNVDICMNSGGTDQHADVIIGSNNRQLSTILNISSGTCP